MTDLKQIFIFKKLSLSLIKFKFSFKKNQFVVIWNGEKVQMITFS